MHRFMMVAGLFWSGILLAQPVLELNPSLASVVYLQTNAGTTLIQAHQGNFVAQWQLLSGQNAPVLKYGIDRNVLKLDARLTDTAAARALTLRIQIPQSWEVNVDSSGDTLIVSDTSTLVRLTDKSGAVSLRNVRELRLYDQAGDIQLDNSGLSGNARLMIEDGSGAIRLQNASGYISIRDDAGNMALSQLTGKVIVDDGSGHIDIDGLRGSVAIRDGSGDIRIRNAEQLVMEQDSSGELVLQNVSKVLQGR